MTENHTLALDLLFGKRKELLEKYEYEIIDMSLSEDNRQKRRCNRNLGKIHEQLQFIARIINLVRSIEVESIIKH